MAPSTATNRSPLFIATGRNDLSERVGNSRKHPTAKVTHSGPTNKMYERLHVLADTRELILKRDDKALVGMSISPRLISGAQYAFRHYDMVSVRLPARKSWPSGFGFLISSGRNTVIERGGRLVKIHTHRVRTAFQINDEDKEKGNLDPAIPEKESTDPPANDRSTSS